METYFAFSDDSGDYINKENRSGTFIRKHPFCINSCFIIPGRDYASIKNDFVMLRNNYDLPSKELKFWYIWPIKESQSKNTIIMSDKDYYPFKDIPWHKLMSFVDDSIRLINKYDGKALFTITDNNLVDDYSQSGIISMHIQDIMQKVQMHMQDLCRNNPQLNCQAQLLFDTQGSQKDRMKYKKYNNILRNDRFIENFDRIIDNPSFWNSEYSYFLQIADYLAGVFNGFMRGYQESATIFRNNVYPILRKDASSNVLGWGICEIPTKRGIAERVKQRLRDYNLIHSIDDIPF
jgi:hypothetical protein